MSNGEMIAIVKKRSPSRFLSLVNLAISNVSMGIPPAFELPMRREEFLSFDRAHPSKLCVQKSNRHRGIQIKKLDELNLAQDNSFVQEYIANPFLVDKRKFDIGIYTVVTSVNPLRVYIYEGDALLRFCPENYHPFNPDIVDKYVMRSLMPYYVDQEMTFRESLNAHVRSVGKYPERIWAQIRETILLVFPVKANMTPNLSSGHFIQNKLLYEQVLMNILSLVGVATQTHSDSLEIRSHDEQQMLASNRDLRVFADMCASSRCRQSCDQLSCKLCRSCLDERAESFLRQAYQEHLARRNMRRVIPAPVGDRGRPAQNPTTEDRLLELWFQTKCELDSTWCQ